MVVISLSIYGKPGKIFQVKNGGSVVAASVKNRRNGGFLKSVCFQSPYLHQATYCTGTDSANSGADMHRPYHVGLGIRTPVVLPYWGMILGLQFFNALVSASVAMYSDLRL